MNTIRLAWNALFLDEAGYAEHGTELPRCCSA